MHRTKIVAVPLLVLWPLAFGCSSESPTAEPAASSGSETPEVTPEVIPEEDEAPADPAVAEMRDHIASLSIDKTRYGWKQGLELPPQLSFTPGKTYYWTLDTNHGRVKIRLMPEVAPMHVSSTIFLTELGFYDELTFHRIIPGFMAQGGCPLGTGTGSPGQRYRMQGEFDPSVRHDRGGLLSMANSGPGTDGSQFFLTFKETPHLNDKHTIFGEITSGLETMGRLEAVGTPRGAPKSPVTILEAVITVE